MKKRDGLILTLYLIAFALGINEMSLGHGFYWAGLLQVIVVAVLFPLRFFTILRRRKPNA